MIVAKGSIIWLSDWHGIDGGDNDGEGGGGGRAADAMLRCDPRGEAFAASGGRGGRWVAAEAGRPGNDGNPGARQGQRGETPGRWQLQMEQTRAPPLPAAPTIVLNSLPTTTMPFHEFMHGKRILSKLLFVLVDRYDI